MMEKSSHKSDRARTGGVLLMSNNVAFLMFQSDTSSNVPSAGMGIGIAVIWLVVMVVLIAAMWKVFEKAGEPGWAAIIPIYNLYILLKIAGRPGWWILLFLIPFVNFIIAIVVAFDVAKRFGKGAGFALGLVFLPFIFYPLLAWGDAQYHAAPAAA
jgi:uncharacterized membrane protein YhaH (DUF805 family)